MATITDQEKAQIRNAVERKAIQEGIAVYWIKAALNDAAQAVEDLLVNNAAAISNVINNASQPHGVTFTANEKKWIVALTILMKYNRDIA